MHVGEVVELWRYPVKSFQGERLERNELGPKTFAGDRAYAVRHREDDKVLTAKRYGRLLEASARTEADGSVVVDIPGAGEHGADDPGLAKVISAWLDVPCRLERPVVSEAPEFEMSFDAAQPERDLFAWPCAEGTFLDLAAAHVLTTSSLAAAGTFQPDTTWDVRRFRPNVLVDTGDAEGFVEDAWVGQVVTIGGASVAVLMPTVRCPMPSRAQPGGLDRDLGVAATLRDHHDNNLGIYATVETPGAIAVGDPVTVAPAPA
jgi:uncharacterized protein